MDDERIERALRAGPPDEPTYVRSITALDSPILRRSANQRRSRGIGRLLATTAIAAAVLVAVLYLRPFATDTGPGGHDLLADVRSAGTLHVAVTKDSPQLSVPGVGIDGFDVDVARAIGQHLGVSVQIDAVDAAEIERGDWRARWDLAIDSAISTPDRAMRLRVGSGYYSRSAAVITADPSPIRGLADLDGKTVCATTGSLASEWVAGRLGLSGGAVSPPPDGTRLLARASADQCLAAVRTSTASAFIADWTLDIEPGIGFTRVADPPFVGVAAVAVDPGRPGSDRLLMAVDDVLSGLRADGTLRSLSERRFGGQDLTALPSN